MKKKPIVESCVVKLIADYNMHDEHGVFTQNPREELKKRDLTAREIEQAFHDGTVVDRAEGDERSLDRGEYRYWVWCDTVCKERAALVKIGWSRGRADREARKYARVAYEQVRALEHNDWQYVGVLAQCRVLVPLDKTNYRIQDFESGGLWGVEYGNVPVDMKYNKRRAWRVVTSKIDEHNDYIKSVAQEELNDLAQHCKTFGVVLPKKLMQQTDIVLCDEHGRPIN